MPVNLRLIDGEQFLVVMHLQLLAVADAWMHGVRVSDLSQIRADIDECFVDMCKREVDVYFAVEKLAGEAVTSMQH